MRVDAPAGRTFIWLFRAALMGQTADRPPAEKNAGQPVISFDERASVSDSGCVRLGRIGTRNRERAISVGAPRLQTKKIARSSGEKIDAPRKILCNGAQCGSIVCFQRIEEFIA